MRRLYAQNASGPDTPESSATAPAGRCRPLSGSGGLRRALADSEQQLQDSRRKLEKLQGRYDSLKQEVKLLNYHLANAHRFAYHDELTGLPNRRLLQDRFTQVAARGVRQKQQIALLFVDLDRFKQINDMYGHEVGDAVLVQTATRLAGCIRASDTACRYGGDEFVILLPEIEDREQARTVIEKIRARLAVPYPVGRATITSAASIGLAVCPVGGCELGDLIQASDRDMYRHKARRRTDATGLESELEQSALG